MRTKAPRIKLVDNNQLIIDGDFNFELLPVVYDENYIPTRKISFDWCVEIPQDVLMVYDEEKIMEMFGERLKQAFIKESKKKIKS